MYPSGWSGNVWRVSSAAEEGDDFIRLNNISSISVSQDGLQLAVVNDETKVSVYDTRDRSVINSIDQKTIQSLDSNNLFANAQGIAFAAVSNLTYGLSDDRALKLLFANKSSENEEPIASSIYGKTPSALTEIKNATEDKVQSANIVVSPDTRTFVINDYEKPVAYIGTTEAKTSEERIPAFTSLNKKITSIG